MTERPVRAPAPALPEETAYLALVALDLVLAGAAHLTTRARSVAAAIDKPLASTESRDQACAIALNVIGAAEELARARRLVADLQARRAEIAQDCAAMRATLDQK